MAERIRDHLFVDATCELIKRIYIIIANLPCLECSTHAKVYLHGISLHARQTKDQYGHALCVFNNDVILLPFYSKENKKLRSSAKEKVNHAGNLCKLLIKYV